MKRELKQKGLHKKTTGTVLIFLSYSLITCPQRCFPKVTTKDVTFGQRALFFTFCCQDLHPFKERLKSKSWRRLRTLNTILTVIFHLFSAWIQECQQWGKRFDSKDIKTIVRKNHRSRNAWPSMAQISSKSFQC